MSVHVVGNLCFDTTLVVPRFPRPGETLVASGSRRELGGKGLNQALAAARAGAAVTLYAAVGDADEAAVRARLAAEAGLALALTGLPQPSDASTILVRPDGENCIVSATGCAALYDPAGGEVTAVPVAAGDALLMQGNLAPAATARMLAAARRGGALTVLNPSPLWSEPPPWALVDWLVLNRFELAELSGEGEPERGAEALLGRGVRQVAVTLGGAGAVAFGAELRHATPAPAVDAVDTSGAGDVFCGVLVAGLARRLDPGDALAWATRAASLSVTRRGALASCPTAEDLAALLRPPLARSPS